MLQIHRVVKLNTSLHFALKKYGGVKVQLQAYRAYSFFFRQVAVTEYTDLQSLHFVFWQVAIIEYIEL